MFSNPISRWLIAAILVAAACSRGSNAAEPAPIDWLRGSGRDLQIRLHGEVLEATGGPATGVEITCQLNGTGRMPKLEPTITGNRFEIWLPVNAADENSLWLKAASTDSNRVSYRKLNAFELRQLAIDGIRMSLQTPMRHKTFLIQEQGRPVAGANVKIELGYGIELRSETGVDGVAHFDLLADQQISQVTTWTNDHHIGGYSFDRKPTHDPNDDEFVVELSKCRDERMRVVDEHGTPVPGIEINLQVATPPPNYNFLGTNEHSRIQTDDSGEVVYRWFPDWKDHFFYAELLSPGWVLDGNTEDSPEKVGGAYLFKLKRCHERKTIRGRVTAANTDVGGFYVTLNSFQSERENYGDNVSAFTDADGSFGVDVLPDVRYCAWVLDARWVGDIIDLIPYSASLDKIDSPELSISAGQEVEVVATLGEQNEPYANLGISFRRYHPFQWQENGKTQNESGGPQWWTTTDNSGRATTRTLPGKLGVSVYTPKWRTEQTVDVRVDQPTQIAIHRESSEKHTLHGQLVFTDGLNAQSQHITIQAAAVDGKVNDQQAPAYHEDGSFSLATLGTEIAVFAASDDGKLAGSTIVKELDKRFELKLQPTLFYEGQLIDADRRPLVGHRVLGVVRVENGNDDSAANPTWFDAKRIETLTDQQGNYILEGIPAATALTIYADPIDGTGELTYLDQVLLNPDKSRARQVTKIGNRSDRAVDIPLAERYRNTLRDCAASGYRPLLILAGGTGPIAEFANDHLVDVEKNRAVAGFVPISLTATADALKAEDLAFLNEHDWRLPEPGRILAVALEPDGTELGRVEVDVRDPQSAAAAAADFIQQHAPPQQDAEEEWAAAFAEAERSNRRVWARVSGRFCGPCFSLARWLDAQHALLEKDYVMLKIEDNRDLHGADVAGRITRGKQHGIPFYAIFAADGLLLIDSAGPLGNIGYPSDNVEGKRHLKKMLLETRRNLTDSEIEQLVEKVESQN